MYFAGVGCAVPPTSFTQSDCWFALRGSPAFNRLSALSRHFAERILLGDSGIRTRHLAVPSLEAVFDASPSVLHARFAEHAPALASRAATSALERANLAAPDIDALLVSTCTGYLCPGLSSYVAERLGLRADVIALDLVGQGCAAALPNLGAAQALLASGRCSNALSICVEVCSAAFYLDDDPGVLLSACLFGDGAAAVVLRREATAHAREVRWLEGWSHLDPARRDALRMDPHAGTFRNTLLRSVPTLAAASASALVEKAARNRGFSREDLRAWIWHAGGRAVLDQLREAAGLEEGDMRLSRDIFRRYGNLSSPFVLFVLEAALAQPAPEGLWWMSTFGAGFACHGALLQVGRA